MSKKGKEFVEKASKALTYKGVTKSVTLRKDYGKKISYLS